MYSVVGCCECHALWIVDDDPERSQCPKCRSSRAFDARGKFVRTDDRNHAREVRARLLAAQSDHEDAFAAVGSFDELEGRSTMRASIPIPTSQRSMSARTK